MVGESHKAKQQRAAHRAVHHISLVLTRDVDAGAARRNEDGSKHSQERHDEHERQELLQLGARGEEVGLMDAVMNVDPHEDQHHTAGRGQQAANNCHAGRRCARLRSCPLRQRARQLGSALDRLVLHELLMALGSVWNFFRHSSHHTVVGIGLPFAELDQRN
ncbi:MAG: hypothetical protein A2138_19265 [Deltaproteobacteria bacterium RBG_16_71_12]|nr:MAG: hypothetical protein A2138_19265 [Deltaproteobacteria bacterium RBG_16_71_12]